MKQKTKNADIEYVKKTIRRIENSLKPIEEDEEDYTVESILLIMSVGLIVGGGIFKSLTTIISGTILLIFFCWSLRR